MPDGPEPEGGSTPSSPDKGIRCHSCLNSRTKGQIEAEISEAMARLQRERTGRGPTQAHTHVIQDMIVVRLMEVLTPAERQLTGNPHGQSLVKQFHQQMHEVARKDLEAIILEHTGCRVNSVHSDVSTKTGEQMAIFVLDENLESLLPRRAEASGRR